MSTILINHSFRPDAVINPGIANEGHSLVRPALAFNRSINFVEHGPALKMTQDRYVGNYLNMIKSADGSSNISDEVLMMKLKSIYLSRVHQIDPKSGEQASTNTIHHNLLIGESETPSINVVGTTLQHVFDPLDDLTLRQLEISIIPRLIQSYLYAPKAVSELTSDTLLRYLGYVSIDSEQPPYVPVLVELVNKLHYLFTNTPNLSQYKNKDGGYDLAMVSFMQTALSSMLHFIHIGETLIYEDASILLSEEIYDKLTSSETQLSDEINKSPQEAMIWQQASRFYPVLNIVYND